MDKYIGLDVHAKSCTLAVMSSTGKRLSWQVVETNGEALIDAVKAIRGHVYVCMEEGTQSAWLYELLSPLVAEVVVVAVVSRGRGNKNDTEDAFGLAELHRTRSFQKCVYKDVGRYKTLRSLVRTYGFLVMDLVRCQNRLKAAYRSEGVSTSGTEMYREDAQEAWLLKLDESHQVSAGVLHEEYRALLGLKETTEKAMLAEAGRFKQFKLLQTVPGIGPIRSAQLMSVVVTPMRFRHKRQFWKYCGLAIVTHSSSDWVREGGGPWERKKVQQTRGLNWDHNPVLKNIMKGAAMTVIQKTSGPLRADYDNLQKNGTKPNLAALTIARKVAAIVLSVWKKGIPYDESYGTEANKKSVEARALKT